MDLESQGRERLKNLSASASEENSAAEWGSGGEEEEGCDEMDPKFFEAQVCEEGGGMGRHLCSFSHIAFMGVDGVGNPGGDFRGLCLFR